MRLLVWFFSCWFVCFFLGQGFCWWMADSGWNTHRWEYLQWSISESQACSHQSFEQFIPFFLCCFVGKHVVKPVLLHLRQSVLQQIQVRKDWKTGMYAPAIYTLMGNGWDGENWAWSCLHKENASTRSGLQIGRWCWCWCLFCSLHPCFHPSLLHSFDYTWPVSSTRICVLASSMPSHLNLHYAFCSQQLRNKEARWGRSAVAKSKMFGQLRSSSGNFGKLLGRFGKLLYIFWKCILVASWDFWGSNQVSAFSGLRQTSEPWGPTNPKTYLTDLWECGQYILSIQPCCASQFNINTTNDVLPHARILGGGVWREWKVGTQWTSNASPMALFHGTKVKVSTRDTSHWMQWDACISMNGLGEVVHCTALACVFTNQPNSLYLQCWGWGYCPVYCCFGLLVGETPSCRRGQLLWAGSTTTNADSTLPLGTMFVCLSGAAALLLHGCLHTHTQASLQ